MENNQPSLIEQLRRVLKDTVDYLASVLTLLQAQAAHYALSAITFTLLILFAALLGLTAFIILNIALGVWLSQVTGHAGWSLLILGGFYAILAMAAAYPALRWLKKLRS